MPAPHPDGLLAAERARSAALRLKHDLGKGVRFRAPREVEASDAALRERLTRDLLATRETPEGTLSAPQVLARWRREDEAALTGSGVENEISDLAALVHEIEAVLPRLAKLRRADLLRLDACARRVHELCGIVFMKVTSS